MTRQKGKRQNPMDKGPTGLVSGTVHQCKFCEKLCTSESGLTNHINNVHQERQNIFRCCKCGHKYNIFNMYIEHLRNHPKSEYRCCSYARYVNMSPRLYQNLTSTRTSCTTPHPENYQQYIPKMRRWYVIGDTELWWKISRKRWTGGEM